ncbi:MAG: hypothetical protein Q8O40_16420 [Chloroflexota bacterium]|nr:hypothetical protein [Chloroflexota bacterium]
MADEAARRERRCLELHLRQAGFEDVWRLEDSDWSVQITLDKRLLDAVFSLDFLARHERHATSSQPAS